MGLEDFAGKIHLSETDKATLLSMPAVNFSVKNSAIYSLGVIARKVGNYRDNLKPSTNVPRIISKGFVNGLFPYFKALSGNERLCSANSRGIPILGDFWKLVHTYGGRGIRAPLLGELERYSLARDNGAPALFLGMMMDEASQAKRYDLINNYFDPIYREIKTETFNTAIAANW